VSDFRSFALALNSKSSGVHFDYTTNSNSISAFRGKPQSERLRALRSLPRFKAPPIWFAFPRDRGVNRTSSAHKERLSLGDRAMSAHAEKLAHTPASDVEPKSLNDAQLHGKETFRVSSGDSVEEAPRGELKVPETAAVDNAEKCGPQQPKIGRRAAFLAYIKTRDFWIVLILGSVTRQFFDKLTCTNENSDC
jgi:hypothetical protein